MEKIHLYDKILSPLVTEKSTNLSEQNKIVFKVPNKSNKMSKSVPKFFISYINKIVSADNRNFNILVLVFLQFRFQILIYNKVCHDI